MIDTLELVRLLDVQTRAWREMRLCVREIQALDGLPVDEWLARYHAAQDQFDAAYRDINDGLLTPLQPETET